MGAVGRSGRAKKYYVTENREQSKSDVRWNGTREEDNREGIYQQLTCNNPRAALRHWHAALRSPALTARSPASTTRRSIINNKQQHRTTCSFVYLGLRMLTPTCLSSTHLLLSLHNLFFYRFIPTMDSSSLMQVHFCPIFSSFISSLPFPTYIRCTECFYCWSIHP